MAKNVMDTLRERGFIKQTVFEEELYEKLGKEMTLRIVTTLRQDALKGLISKESPVGKALLGHRVDDRVLVKVSDDLQYHVVIRSIEKGTDDESLAISSY